MEKTRSDLLKFMAGTGVKQAAISRAIGYDKGGAALSQWLAGKYPGDNARITEAVRGFLKREERKAGKTKQEVKFVMTTTAEQVFDIADSCHLGGEIGVCIGEPGVGKTFAVKEYVKRNTGAILIEADLSYTARDVFSELHRKCGGSGALSLGKMKDDIIDRLRDSGRLIIVDEAEFLPIRAIDLLRRVYDRAGVGVLFVGLPRLFEGLIRKKGDYAYILSRIGIKTVIGALSLTDVSEIVNQVAESPVEVSEAFLQQSGGNNRKLNKLLKKCLKAKEVGLRQQITPETIGQAADKLMI